MKTKRYRTPIGTFDDPDAAVDACLQCDFDPDSCIRVVETEHGAGVFAAGRESLIAGWEVVGQDHESGGAPITLRGGLDGFADFADAERTADLLRQCGYRTRFIRPLV